MKNILIDTDVILDFFFDSVPFSEQSTQIFSLCELGKINGFVTPVICSNVYYMLRQTSRHEKVIEKMSQLLIFLDVLLMDKDVVNQALRSGFRDFEDALQNFAAIKSRLINVIVTRNIKDYKNSEISILTPDGYLESLKAGL